MTLDEAYEILGVSKDASPVLVRVAYKEKRKSAGTKFESELYSEAYLTIIGTRPADPVSADPPLSTQKQHPKSTPATTSRPKERGNSEIVHARRTSVDSHRPGTFSEDSPLPQKIFENLQRTTSSRTYASHKAKAFGILSYETGPLSENWDISIAPDQNSFLIASADWCYKWDISSGNVIKKFSDHSISDSYGCDISESGSHSLTTGYEGEIIYRDYKSNNIIYKLLGHSDIARKVRFIPGSDRAISVGWDGRVLLWNLSDGTFKDLIGGNSRGHITGLDISRSGKRAYISDGGNLDVWDIETQSLAWSKPLCNGSSFFAISVSPNERLAVCSSQSGLNWIDLVDRRIIQRYNSENESLYYLKPEPAADFSRDGLWCLTASDKGLILWSVPSRKPVRRFTGHTSRVDSVKFSRDGSFALSTGHDSTVRLWRL